MNLKEFCVKHHQKYRQLFPFMKESQLKVKMKQEWERNKRKTALVFNEKGEKQINSSAKYFLGSCGVGYDGKSLVCHQQPGDKENRGEKLCLSRCLMDGVISAKGEETIQVRMMAASKLLPPLVPSTKRSWYRTSEAECNGRSGHLIARSPFSVCEDISNTSSRADLSVFDFKENTSGISEVTNLTPQESGGGAGSSEGSRDSLTPHSTPKSNSGRLASEVEHQDKSPPYPTTGESIRSQGESYFPSVSPVASTCHSPSKSVPVPKSNPPSDTVPVPKSNPPSDTVPVPKSNPPSDTVPVPKSNSPSDTVPVPTSEIRPNLKKTSQVKRRGGSCNVKANYPMRLTRSVVRKIKAFEKEAMIASPESFDTWVSSDSETHRQEDSDDTTKSNHDNHESNTTESDNTSPAVVISQERMGQITGTESPLCEPDAPDLMCDLFKPLSMATTTQSNTSADAKRTFVSAILHGINSTEYSLVEDEDDIFMT